MDYGALPELVPEWAGRLSAHGNELVEAMKHERYDALRIHRYVAEQFNARRMASEYLEKYKAVIAAHTLNAKRPVALQSFDKLEWQV